MIVPKLIKSLVTYSNKNMIIHFTHLTQFDENIHSETPFVDVVCSKWKQTYQAHIQIYITMLFNIVLW